MPHPLFFTPKGLGYTFGYTLALAVLRQFKKAIPSLPGQHLMMLAFLVDQTQQIAYPLFQAVLKKLKLKKYLWEKMRIFFR